MFAPFEQHLQRFLTILPVNVTVLLFGEVFEPPIRVIVGNVRRVPVDEVLPNEPVELIPSVTAGVHRRPSVPIDRL